MSFSFVKGQLSWLILTPLLIFSVASWAQPRTTVTLSQGWTFSLGANEGAESPNFDDSEWQSVSVPHDWAIAGPFEVNGDGNTGKLPWKGEGWYRLPLDIPANYAGKSVYLVFDGVMAFPEVFVNGELAGKWDYGYNSFVLDITQLLNPGGNNLLAVHADTREHDSRWYPGAGIYRKVQMVVVAPHHVDMWGIHVTTPIVKPHYADVRVRTTLRNAANSGDTLRLLHEILNPQGEVVASDKTQGFLAAGQSKDFEVNLVLHNPTRWDIEHPTLYRVRTTLSVGETSTDEVETEFGIRTFRFDPDHGFFLNDRRVQLKGVNLHHDHGPLGAAFYPRAMERQLQMMRDMGVNAIRNSHNVAAPELLELCDRMGFVVMDEIFDKYDQKADITDDTDFEEFAHRNIRNFVVRDRNHPSIVLWSVGNEIGDVQWNINSGFHRLHTMLNYVNKYDPSRPTTLVNDSWASAAGRHFDYYDVHSWNYDRRYRLARQMEPNKAVIISESASTLSTRGFYEFPLPTDKTATTRSLQVSSYDLHAPYWAEIADDDFMWQQEESYLAGEFVWTGFDYLGEPEPYTNQAVKKLGMTDREASRSSYFGAVDLVGIPKDRFYLYKSYWNQAETTIHILPHWNWPDRVGQPVPVFVYTNGDCAELFLNGVSQGMRCKEPKAQESVKRFRLMWNEVLYQPGELRVVAYKEGKEIGTQRMITAGPATQLVLSADRQVISADGMDLSYVLVEARDREGRLAPLADHMLQVQVSGAGILAGLGNGNPQSFHAFQGEVVPLFYGKAMIILRSGLQAGDIRLSISADGLGKQELRVAVK